MDQDRADRDPKRVLIEGELAMLVEQCDPMAREALAAVERPACTGVDTDVLPGKSEHQERHQHVVLDRRAT